MLGDQREPTDDEFGMMETDIEGNAVLPLYVRRQHYALRRRENRAREIANWNWSRFGARSSFPTGAVGQLQGTVPVSTPEAHQPADVDDYARLQANQRSGKYVGQFRPFGGHDEM